MGTRKEGSLQPLRVGSARYDQARILKSLLIRRDVLLYLGKVMPKMEQYVTPFLAEVWYKERGVDTETFVCRESRQVDSDKSDEEIADEPLEVCSTYKCHKPLISLAQNLNMGRYDGYLCKVAGASTVGRSLDLAQSAELLKLITTVQTAYNEDFQAKESEETSGGAVKRVDSLNMDVLYQHAPLTDTDYRAMHDQWEESNARSKRDAIKAFILDRLVFISDGFTGKTITKLQSLPLIKEGRNKLFCYDIATDGLMKMDVVKKRRLNIHAGTGPVMAEDRIKVRPSGTVSICNDGASR